MSGAKKKGSSFAKQAAILASAGILVRIIGFLYRLPLTNMIGDEGNAIYSAGYYIYTFLLILSSAGLPAAISRMVSERIAVGEYENAHRVFRVSLSLSSGLGFIFMVILIVFARPLSHLVKLPDSYWCIMTLTPTLFIVAVMSAYRGYFQGMNTMAVTAVSQIVEQIFNAFFSVYLAYLLLKVSIPEGAAKNIPLGAAGGTAGTGVGALAGLMVMFIAYVKFAPVIKRNRRSTAGDYPLESRGDIARTLFKTALPIIIGTAVFSMTNLIDMVMVMSRLDAAGFTSDEAKVLYGQLSGKYVTLTTLPVSISTAMATAAIPTIAASLKLRRHREVRHKMNFVIRLAMIISIPAAVGIGALGGPIIEMLFPLAPDGGILLTAGAIAIIFLALCQIVTGVLQGIGRVAVPVAGAVLGAVTKVILNYFLISIPQINVLGAVFSTTGCYVVASFFNLYVLGRITKVRFDFKSSLIKPAAASAVMAAACIGMYRLLIIATQSNTLSTLISIAVGAFVYGLVLLLIRGMREEDISAIPMGARLIPVLRRFRLL